MDLLPHVCKGLTQLVLTSRDSLKDVRVVINNFSEVTHGVRNFQFEGQGQRETPVPARHLEDVAQPDHFRNERRKQQTYQ